jgi:hypothetical protein
MNLFIKHKKPLLDFLTGHWSMKDSDVSFYIIEDSMKEEVQPVNNVRSYLIDTTISNQSNPGRYDEKQDSLLWTVDLDEKKLAIERLEKDILLKFKEEI